MYIYIHTYIYVYVYIYIYALWGAAESIADKNHHMKTVAQELRRFLHKIDPTLTDQVYNKDDLAGYDALTASILSLPEFVEFGGFLKCGLSLVIIQLSCFRFSLFSTIQLLGIPHDFGNPKAFRRRLRPWMILIP